jgi:sorting nexin-8
LSLHAPTQDLRAQIVPTARAWHIDRIMEAVDDFLRKQSQAIAARRCKVLFEYVLIADINDGDHVAHDLGQLLQPRSAMLNVIPYNPTSVNHDYRPPTPERAHTFCEIVRSYGVVVIIRQELGQDISGACGQLVIDNSLARPSNANTQCTADMEDLGKAPSHAHGACSRELKPVSRPEAQSSSLSAVKMSAWLAAVIGVPLLMALAFRRS